jgi:hypothetical protein
MAHGTHQHTLAEKAIQSFDAQEKNNMPVFEQGIYQLLDSIQDSRKTLPELKKIFEKNIIEPMNKGLGKHMEFYTLIEKCVKGFEHYKELLAKAVKDYEVYVNTFNASLVEGKKKSSLDVFTDAHKYSSSVRDLIITLMHICDDLMKMRVFAVAKEAEYMKVLSKAFKEYCLFTQQHFGQLTASILQKARFSFDRVVIFLTQIDESFSVEHEYQTGDMLSNELINKLNASREMINQDMKVHTHLSSTLRPTFSTTCSHPDLSKPTSWPGCPAKSASGP